MIKEFYVLSKYHLSVFKRLMDMHGKSGDKRFFIAAIKELKKATDCLIKGCNLKKGAPVRYLKKPGDFIKKISPEPITKKEALDVATIVRISDDLKKSRVDYAKENKIILLVKGKYKFLTAERLLELSESLESSIKKIFKCQKQQ